jgi:Xaa-Pro aminopeptidase
VLTVEPGIYLGADLQPAIGQPVILEQWLGIGIRIEDDVLVTEDGCEVLTDGVPKSVAAMER